MEDQLRFIGRIAALGGIAACVYIFFAIFAGSMGCNSLSDIFSARCSNSWKGALPAFVGALAGVWLLLWSFRADKYDKSNPAILSLVYAAAILFMYLYYGRMMAMSMH